VRHSRTSLLFSIPGLMRAEAQLRQAGAISGARGQRLAQWLREKYRQETVH
jgi:hypothetical protein